jgi:hypothetical protein
MGIHWNVSATPQRRFSNTIDASNEKYLNSKKKRRGSLVLTRSGTMPGDK